MEDRFAFCDVLERFVAQSGYSAGQLARLTGIPKATLANWLQGRVSKPRNLEDLLKLAAALHLDEAQASHLLQAADYPPVEKLLRRPVSENYGELLASWSNSGERAERAPFQAIAELPYFVGRERQLAALERALLRPEHTSIYILHGMGGVGKTTLASHLAYRLRTHFGDGVLWASLGNTDAMSILLTFARALGHDVAEYTDLATRSTVMREALADKCVLIVLDDAGSSEEVRPMLPPSGPSAVIVTTRRRDLGISWGAQRFRVGPFDGKRREALDLFAHMLGRERVQEEEDQFVELADLLGHLPLAIAVAAGRLAYESNWATVDFLERLQRERSRLDELISEDQSVRLSFNLSFKALCPDQRRLFPALGALGGEDFSLEAAAYATDLPLQEAADLLRKLFNLSLIQKGRSNRYRLHPLLRDYARERVEDEDAFERAITYYVNFVEAHETDFDVLDLEVGNVTKALAMAYERQVLPELVRGTNALYPYLATRGLYTVASLHVTRAVEAARKLGNIRGLATALRNQGQLERIRGHYGRASAHLQESLALAGEINDTESVSSTISQLVLVEHMRADYSRAEVYSDEALALIHSQDGPRQPFAILLALGLFKLTQGDCSSAESYLQTGLRLARNKDNALEISSAILALGMTAYKQGNYGRAEARLSEALSLARDVGYGAVESTALMGLGIAAGRRGLYEQATSYLERGLTLSGEVGQSWAVGRLSNEWGEVCLDLGKSEAAATAFRKSLDIARETAAQGLIGEALYGLARVAVAREDLADGNRLGWESLTILKEVQHYRAGEVEQWVDMISQKVAGSA